MMRVRKFKKIKPSLSFIVTITALIFLMIFVVIRRLLPSLLILSSVAFSTIISFNFIYLFKISMNMLTLGASGSGFWHVR
jgi:HAE1 family hydrophobic/amphiphilic exporter-1